MKTFLKPLSFAEEQFYLLQLQRGDPEAKNILIEHNLRLVAHVAKKYQGCDEDQDDLISIGTIGLIKAISTFDPSRTSKLSTYAARCIDNELPLMLWMIVSKRTAFPIFSVISGQYSPQRNTR